jgi:hypothetical protein
LADFFSIYPRTVMKPDRRFAARAWSRKLKAIATFEVEAVASSPFENCSVSTQSGPWRDRLHISQYSNGTVGECDATKRAAINGNFLTTTCTTDWTGVIGQQISW